MHHKLIQSLIDRIRSLQAENASLINERNNLSESLEYQQSESCRMEERNQELANDRRRIERKLEQERQDAQNKEWEADSLIKKIQRAEDWNDSYSAEKYKRQLKNLF